MPGLGNRSFQGLGLPSDLARRLEDLARQISANQSDVATLKSSAIDAPTAATIAHSVAQKIATSTVLNITNATGVAGTPQPASIPTVTSLPLASASAVVGTAVIFENDIWTWSGSAWIQAVKWLYEDTHANRLLNYPAANYPVGTLFYETNSTQTDRQSLYVVQAFAGVNQWVFIAGLFAAAFIQRPTDLGIYDFGFHFYATDWTVGEDWNGTHWVYRYGRTYGSHGILATVAASLTAQEIGWLVSAEQYGHRFYWNATGWAFEPGEDSQYVVMASSASAPAGGPWYPCDGGTYACQNSDGSLTNITTPNLNGSVAAIMGGGFNGTVHAATAPTLASGVVIGNDSDAGTDVLPAGATLVALNPHSHAVTDAVIKAPSVANGGLPAYFTTAWYLRA